MKKLLLIFLFLQITNASAFDLTISSPSLDMLGQVDFTIDSFNPCVAIDGYESCSINGDYVTIIYPLNFSLINASGNLNISISISGSTNGVNSWFIYNSVEYNNMFSFVMSNNTNVNTYFKLTFPYKGVNAINNFSSFLLIEAYYE